MLLSSIRNRHLLLWDALLLAGIPFLAYAIRFEALVWSPANSYTALIYAALSLPLKFSIFIGFGLYSRLWRHASTPEMSRILEATVGSAVACSLLGIVVLPASGATPLRVPISVMFMDAFFTVAIVAFPRFLLKAIDYWKGRQTARGKRALIVGAGAAGGLILKELRANPQLGLNPVGFVDDDPNKHHQRLGDLPVLGSLDDIPEIVPRHSINEIIIAMPTAPGSAVRRVVHSARQVGVPTRTMPAVFEIVSGRVSVSALRNVEIHDLLRREPVETNLAAVRASVANQTVLVTGAGGSIGSELARQIASLGPERLVLLGNCENDIFDIATELGTAHPDLSMTSVIADVRDDVRLRGAFRKVRPQVVFHAAAHKHVPLMEADAAEAITNNVLGTKNVVNRALECDVDRLVLISTDKAVRPVSVMGATKRAAELVVQCASVGRNRTFLAVRFGNVLGSRGSVVPTFLEQIRAGGPVTITHPEMRRYFMTIPEAVQLVLQAAAMGQGGEVFMLDMGNPVRIVDLAADLIRLSGLEVGKDIQIEFTGIRPGERLNEELFLQGEDVVATAHPKILRVRNTRLSEMLDRRIDDLIAAARQDAANGKLMTKLALVVPEFGAWPARAARRHWTQRQRIPALVSERRSGVERRTRDRRVQAMTARLIRVKEERRNGRDRRCGIDRRAVALPMASAASGTFTSNPTEASL